MADYHQPEDLLLLRDDQTPENPDPYLDIGRDVRGIECACGGYMRRADALPEERAAHGFVCRVCGRRAPCAANAPEME